MKFKPIDNEDCDLLFKWTNDETVRQNAFNTNPISYEEHTNWFKSKLNSNQTTIYICFVEGDPIGQIRVDLEGETGIISYSIDKNFRGRGYGTEILMEITDLVLKNNSGVKKLAGRVKYNNIASQKAFEKVGYSFIKETDYIEYYKYL